MVASRRNPKPQTPKPLNPPSPKHSNCLPSLRIPYTANCHHVLSMNTTGSTGREITYVVKRDGRQEPFHFGKLSGRLKKLSYGLSAEDCDHGLVSRKVCAGLYNGVTTTQLDESAAEIAAAMATDHPSYASLAARIAVSYLHKNTRKSFSATVKGIHGHYNEKSGLKAPLIADDVYEIIMKNAARLDSEIIYDRDFDYDYFGFKILERSYLLKIDGKVVERPQHMLMRASVGIHKDDIDSAIKTYHLMSQLAFVHVSSTLFNAETPIPQPEVFNSLPCMKEDTPKECDVSNKPADVSVHDICATVKPCYYNHAQLDVDGDRELVRFMRELPPAHYVIKIESFSGLLKNLKQTDCDKYECAEFSAGGYKWFLSIYPEGNKKDNGDGHISMYLKMVDKLEATIMVNTSLKFFILDQKRVKYLTILDIKEKHFHALKNEWGVPRLLPQNDFNDVSNGFIIDDSCVFGVEAHVVSKTTVENGGTSLLSVVKESNLLSEQKTDGYTWKIKKFSNLKETNDSPVFTVKGYDWKLVLYPKGCNKHRDQSLSIYLQYSGDLSNLTGDKKLATKFEICLKNQLEGKDMKYTYSAGICDSVPDWGHSNFISLEKFHDPSAGFKANDSVIIQVTIEAVILLGK